MGLLEAYIDALLSLGSPAYFLAKEELDVTVNPPPATTDTGTVADAYKAQSQLVKFLAILGAVVAAPAAYALSVQKRRRKRDLTKKEVVVGSALENASTQATGVIMTALAAPAISTAVAYILVQKMEDAKWISKGLGDATQGLLTVAAAGPAIQGIGQIAGSAFKKGK